MLKRTISTPTWSDKYGRWRCKATAEDGQRKDFYSKNPSPRKGPAGCKRRAMDWLDSLDDPDKIDFAKAWSAYMDYYASRNRATSANVCEARGKAHLLPAFKGRILSSITMREWQAVIDNAYSSGAKSIKTLKGLATTIRGFCKWAASQQYLEQKAVPLYFSYPIGAGVKPKHILQSEELGLLFSPAEDDASWYMPMWRFLTLTGLRRGELCALQRERDYDEATHTITVRESISHEGLVTSGKTENAERTIYLAGLALAQLKAHQEAQKQRGIHDTTYLFTDAHGRRISPRSLRNHWQKWREAHGISLTLHELRHTFISFSRLKTEISLDDLKLLYSHSKAMDTDDTYVHEITLSPEEIKKQREERKKKSTIIDTTFLNIIKNRIQ